MIKNATVAIIGGGNLGASIAEGLVRNGTMSAESITVTKRRTGTLKRLADMGMRVTSDNRQAVRNSDIIILAVKPYTIAEALSGFAADLDPTRHIVVSVASGISIATLRDAIPTNVPLFRAMPNTAAAVCESATCICADGASEQHKQRITTLFESIGTAVLINEDLMEAATVLGACGIAFVLRFMRAMVQGGIQIGFDAATANAIAGQTIKGATELLIQNGCHPEEEIDKVTTPKGCTIAGLNEMEHQGFSSSLIKGIVTSYRMLDTAE